MKSIQSSRKEFVVKFKIIFFVLRKSLLGYELSVIDFIYIEGEKL